MKFYLFGSYASDPAKANDIDLVLDPGDRPFEEVWPEAKPQLEALSRRTGKPIDLFLSWIEGGRNDCASYTGKEPEAIEEYDSVIEGLWRFDDRFLGEDFFYGAKEVSLDSLWEGSVQALPSLGCAASLPMEVRDDKRV